MWEMASGLEAGCMPWWHKCVWTVLHKEFPFGLSLAQVTAFDADEAESNQLEERLISAPNDHPITRCLINQHVIAYTPWIMIV